MPGPSNSRGKQKRKSRRGKDNNRAQSKTQSDILLVPLQPQLNQDLSITNNVQARESPPPTHDESSPPSPPSSPCVKTPSPSPYQLQNSKEGTFLLDNHVPRAVEEAMFKQPFIHDPGNGPRVRIARDFISSFFAQPPAFDVSSVPNSTFSKTITTNQVDRTHYAPNLHKKKFCKCFVQYCQKKLLWSVYPSVPYVILKLYCQGLMVQ